MNQDVFMNPKCGLCSKEIKYLEENMKTIKIIVNFVLHI